MLANLLSGVMPMKCPGWVFAVLPFVLFSCADANEGNPRWAAFPVTLYSDQAVVATAESERDFRDAMGFWEEKAGRRLFDYKGVWAGSGKPYSGSASNPGTIFANIIFKPSPWPLNGNVAGQTSFLYTDSRIHGAIVLLNRELATCSGDCPVSYGRTSERRVITHELGHFLGLTHNEKDATNIMYPTVMPGGTLSTMKVDAASLAALTKAD
ncbi:MAG: matrixin family metalloprotease [Proteobacteria bacterium]|nr:MAG: matrixin family metalloprotease [Pseudomonadota bacterium]